MSDRGGADGDGPGNVTVEPAEPGDVDAVADCWVALARGQRKFNSHLHAEENRLTMRDSLARNLAAGGVFVARDEEVVGFVACYLEDGMYEQDVRRGIVSNLFVRPARRGEGIGRALLQTAERHLASSGASVVSLDVMAANEEARSFYAAAGYEPHRIEMERPVETDKGTRGDR